MQYYAEVPARSDEMAANCDLICRMYTIYVGRPATEHFDVPLQ